MVLVDSSVWVLLGELPSVEELARGEEVVTCPPVIEEVLRGVRSERRYLSLQRTFRAMTVLESPMPLEVFEHAALIFRTARAGGLTIRSGYDCLIAACAIRNAASLLHMDRDFAAIARVTTLEARNLAN